MANATNYFETTILNEWFRDVSTSIPASVYVTLLTDDPGEAGSLANEVSGGSFARVQIVSGTGAWSAPADAGSAKRITNSAAVTFPSPTANWGTITHWALMDGGTLGAGNMLVYGALGTARTVLSGDNPPSFAIGSLSLDAS